MSIQPKPPSGNLSAAETYRLVGDAASVDYVLHNAVYKCEMVNGTVQNLTAFHPETTIQWYRASSFALTLDGYNNTAALPSNAPLSNDSPPSNIPSTPLPTALNSTALFCLNSTIAATLPILEPGPPQGLNSAQILGIVIGALVVLAILGVIALYYYGRYLERKKQSEGTTAAVDVGVVTSELEGGEGEKIKAKKRPSGVRISKYDRLPDQEDDMEAATLRMPSPVKSRDMAEKSVPEDEYPPTRVR